MMGFDAKTEIKFLTACEQHELHEQISKPTARCNIKHNWQNDKYGSSSSSAGS